MSKSNKQSLFEFFILLEKKTENLFLDFCAGLYV